ncbi:hypothetical protein CK203_057584 [Vitis vinifera]|uniref:Retrotransposon gag domain-containing protein n=1 Tax=Vitis vinifera TaxID=29760 RepID=A0A438GGV9_VITVI|nr:hypothetical protein CK203_057584 [Vitis vinifera]
MCGGDNHLAWKHSISLEACRGYVPPKGFHSYTWVYLWTFKLPWLQLGLVTLSIVSFWHDQIREYFYAQSRFAFGTRVRGKLIRSTRLARPESRLERDGLTDSAQYDLTVPPTPSLSQSVPCPTPYVLHSQIDVTPPPVVAPIPALEDHMLVALRFILRLYNSVMRAHGLDEAHLIMLFPMSLSGTAQRWKELEALRQGPDKSVTSFISRWREKIRSIVDRPSENDQIGMPLSRAFQKLMEGGLLTRLAPRPVSQPVPPRFRMDLHCSYHQAKCNHEPSTCSLYACSATTPGGIHHIDFVEDDNIHMMSWDDGLLEPIVLNDGYEIDTVGFQTSTPFSLISDWVPFELTPIAALGIARQGPSVPFILRPDDDDSEGRDFLMRGQERDDDTEEVTEYIEFSPSAQTVKAYDSTKRKVMGTLMIELLIGPTTFPILFQTLEVEDFCRDFVAMSFDQHSSMMVLDMMRGMSFMLGMGLGRRQRGPMDFVATVDHDAPFGFVPTEANYRYMARLSRERVRARLTCTPFDYPIHPYRMSLTDYFVRGSELGDETSGVPISVMIVPSSPNRANFLSLCFPKETIDCGVDVEPTRMIDGVFPHDDYRDEMDTTSMSQITERVQPESASPFNLCRVSAIEIVEEIQTVLAPELMEDVAVGNDLFEDTFRSIEEAFNIVDPPLSFDIFRDSFPILAMFMIPHLWI